MSSPAVELTERDGKIGVLPPSEGALPVYVGAATAGPLTPGTFSTVPDLLATYTEGAKLPGSMICAAAHAIAQGKGPVVIIRTGATNPGEDGTLDDEDFGGTSVPTLDATNEPVDDIDLVIKWIKGGAVETTGMTYRVSFDNGVSFGALRELGVATSLVVPELGDGWAIDLAAGTILTGAILRVRTTAPIWAAGEMTTALTSLRNWVGSWDLVYPVGDMTATGFDAIETAIAGMRAVGKEKTWFGCFRRPLVGETSAEYKTAFDAALGAKSTTSGAISAGVNSYVSAVNGSEFARPAMHVIFARESGLSEEGNAAEIGLGPLPGRITDSNGNPWHHDESVAPGLDDSRAYVLKSDEDEPGVFVNRPRLFSTETSDFQLVPHRRVMNRAKRVLRAYLKKRLNKPIRVNKKTGFITETDRKEIEMGANRALADALLAKPKASNAYFVLSKTDNVLATKTLTGACYVVPLAYPELINVDPVSFLNPALQTIAA